MSQPAQFDFFQMEREFAVALPRLFNAFADPERKRSWYAEGHHHDIEHYSMEFEVGGREVSRYRFKKETPFPGALLESDGVILDIVPNQRIVIASTMAKGPHRFSAAVHTFEFSETTVGGSRMVFSHQAAFFEGADGPELRRAGWEQLFAQLQTSLID